MSRTLIKVEPYKVEWVVNLVHTVQNVNLL